MCVFVQLPSGSDDQWVGFSGLNLCGPDGWKETVQVCLPLFAIANRTNPNAETLLQGNYCSFARALIERRDPPVSPLPSTNCTPYDGKLNLKELRLIIVVFSPTENVFPFSDLSNCCKFEFSKCYISCNIM